jgi:hypothetical protein
VTAAARRLREFCAELIGTNSVTAQKMVVTSATPILGLCRQLVAGGHDPATPLEAYRGDTLCVRIRSIGQAAQLEPSPSGVGFVRRHSRLGAGPPRLRAGPPVAPTASAGHPMPPSQPRAPTEGAS